MTFSLLARDPDSGALGGAAATGNLCVGAWVLRGKAGVGISASQGHHPSTLWGEAVLEEIAKGAAPKAAVQNVIDPDNGRASRQLLALDQQGEGAVFSGDHNVPSVSDFVSQGICAGGNVLSCPMVADAMVGGYRASRGTFVRRLLAGLVSGASDGGDARGLMSAAILIVAKDHPPIDLRVDYAQDPLADLSDLVNRIEAADYARWMRSLPTVLAPFPV
ncbi:MAG: DUF1028 domain-containing protein [Pseudomonadota bacterium]